MLLWISNMYHIFLVCVCSPKYPGCTCTVLYCHLSPVWLYHIFPHYITHSTIFEKKVIEHKGHVFILIYSFHPKKFSFYVSFHTKYPLMSDFNETWIFLTDFLIIIKCQISWKSFQWEQSCSMGMDWQPYGQTDKHTDRHDKASSHFSQFCKCTMKLVHLTILSMA